MGPIQNLTLVYKEESVTECGRTRTLLSCIRYVLSVTLWGNHISDVLAGDMEILFDRHKGWGYKAEIAEKYGGVVHLHGMFGVSSSPLLC